MSTSDLPKTLVVLLDTLNSEYGLSSWNSRSGQDYTTVQIRFDHAAITGPNTTEAVKYKRVPQSRIERDMARTARWRDRYHNEHIDGVEYVDEETQIDNGQKCESSTIADDNMQLPQGDQGEKRAIRFHYLQSKLI